MDVFNIYYGVDKHGIDKITMHKPVYTIGKYESDIIECYDLFNESCAIMVSGRYIAHSLTGPAMTWCNSELVAFCVEGVVTRIEDMPVDPTLKLMWKLIYGDSNKFGLYNR